MESNISENVTPKLVGMIVAIIVLACVMIPICNSLVSDGNGGGSGSGEITASNEPYVINKMAYGTNPVFEITPTEDKTKMPVLYADSTTAILRLGNRDSVLYINGEGISDNLDMINVFTITKVTSDGQTVTVDFLNRQSASDSYSFDIASPCYYADANGEYGVYINPSALSQLPPIITAPSTYDSLYIPIDYTPHIIASTNMSLMMGYDKGHIWGINADIKYQPTEYYDISDNKITDAGWILPYRNTEKVEEKCPSLYMILPNKVTMSPVVESDEFTMTLKDLYGEEYPWATISNGYICGSPQYEYDQNPPLVINNPDFKQMPWETGQTTLDSFLDPAFWSVVTNNDSVGYKLDLLALMNHYQPYTETFINCTESAWSNGEGTLPVYMIMTNAEHTDHPSDVVKYFSPIGVMDIGNGLEYGMMPNAPSPSDLEFYSYNTNGRVVYDSAYILFQNDTGTNGRINAQFFIEYDWTDDNNESHHVSIGGEKFVIDSILFLSESTTGYIPLSLDATSMGSINYSAVKEYFVCSQYMGVADTSGNRVLSIIDVEKTKCSEEVYTFDMDNPDNLVPITGVYCFNNQSAPVDRGEYMLYTPTAKGGLTFEQVGYGMYGDITEGGGNYAYMGNFMPATDSQGIKTIERIYSSTLALTAPAEEGGSGGDGSGSGSGGVSGISATIIKLLPVFVAIGLILAMVSMFYDPRELLGGQQ